MESEKAAREGCWWLSVSDHLVFANVHCLHISDTRALIYGKQIKRYCWRYQSRDLLLLDPVFFPITMGMLTP